MKVKICGLKTVEDIQYINEFKPDFAGFIFAPQSKRKISFEQALLMKQELNKNIKSVGVFSDDSIENILTAVKNNIIDFIQLHGDESNDYIEILKSKTKAPIIKALKADNELKEKINTTKADYVLIDSSDKNSFGGTGKVFDWGLIPECNKKIFLAGGLNIQNIESAIKTVNPYCVDINSGVETDGKKDPKKIEEIMNFIKRI